MPRTAPLRVVVLASGTGTLLQALLDARPAAGSWTVTAVGSDLHSCQALDRAAAAGVPTFTVALADHPTRADWDAALAAACADADLIVSAGFMKLVGPAFLAAHDGKMINSHPSLLPSFPGMHAARDALAYGVHVTGCTIFLVDAGVDAGPIVAQEAVRVLPDDTVASLHERIKVAERGLLVSVVTSLATHGWRVAGRKVVPS
ncbi:phosphoribosylglycinamide formyltransferase [Nakamurella deserti]|uniref:phosphoribosylglycinamide formyltransferase n=1 Tax=Nakamurella deserti TaxID=2164074 RepID=UPI001478B5A1|nr:phosphoribosylglycinamide formyltransferase [Nakamurella deserti]